MNRASKSIILFLLIFSLSRLAHAEGSQPLKFTIKADKDIYYLGDTVTILYDFENISDGSLEIPRGKFSFQMRNEDGKPLESHSSSLPRFIDVGSSVLVSGNGDDDGQAKDRIAQTFELKPKAQRSFKQEVASFTFDEIKKSTVPASPYYSLPSLDIVYAGPVLRKYSHRDEERVEDIFLEELPRTIIGVGQYCPALDPFGIDISEECLDSNLIKIKFLLSKDREGIVKDYFPYGNGALKFQLTYRNGQLNGPAIFYYENGSVASESQYQDGKLHGEAKEYYLRGGLEQQWYFKKGVPVGETKAYTEDGGLLAKANYENGQLNGPMQTFEHETVRTSANFLNGQLHGLVTDSVFDTKLKKRFVAAIESYKNGQLEFQKSFSPQEQLQSERSYENGKLTNLKEYDETGHVIWDYDYCDEEQKAEKQFPFDFKMFFKEIHINEVGILMSMKDNFKERFKFSPIFLNPRFDGQRLSIAKDDDLHLYGLDLLPEGHEVKKYFLTKDALDKIDLLRNSSMGDWDRKLDPWEERELQEQAFIACYPQLDKNDEIENIPYNCLFLSKLDKETAHFLLMTGIRGKEQKGYTTYLHVDDFVDVKKCAPAGK